jgi:hypothetical protein
MKLPYNEGSILLVPLVNGGGYACGVIARSTQAGKVIFGYFFGPRLASVVDLPSEEIDPSMAIFWARFGDLGLINHKWPVVGTVRNWNRNKWPMPDFVRRDPLGKLKPRLVKYADDDPNRWLDERPIDSDVGLQPDSLYGYAAVEIALSKLLAADKA